MASTIDCSLIREPQLLDLIDEDWARDKLPDDGGRWAVGWAGLGWADLDLSTAARADLPRRPLPPCLQTSRCPRTPSC